MNQPNVAIEFTKHKWEGRMKHILHILNSGVGCDSSCERVFPALRLDKACAVPAFFIAPESDPSIGHGKVIPRNLMQSKD